jgi:hypothetical protein
LWTILREQIFNSLNDKRSNRVETIQHFKKCFFSKLVLGFQWEPKSKSKVI